MKVVKLTPEQISIILGLVINRVTYLKGKNPTSKTALELDAAVIALAAALNSSPEK